MRREYKICVIFILVGLGSGIFLGLGITKLSPSTFLDIVILLLGPLTGISIGASVAIHCQDWGTRYEYYTNLIFSSHLKKFK